MCGLYPSLSGISHSFSLWYIDSRLVSMFVLRDTMIHYCSLCGIKAANRPQGVEHGAIQDHLLPITSNYFLVKHQQFV